MYKIKSYVYYIYVYGTCMDADTYGKESNKKSKTITTMCGKKCSGIYIYILTCIFIRYYRPGYFFFLYSYLLFYNLFWLNTIKSLFKGLFEISDNIINKFGTDRTSD